MDCTLSTYSTLDTPFHYFCETWPTPSLLVHCFELLIQHGVDVTLANGKGETPLHKAVLNPRVRYLMVQLLVKNENVDTNDATNEGETALHYAIHSERADLVELLLQGNASPVTRYKNGKTAYDLAIELKNPQVIATVSKAKEFYDWLDKHDLEKYYAVLTKEQIFPDTLLEAGTLTHQLLVNIGIKYAGDRIRIVKAIKKLRDGPSAPSAEGKLPQSVS